MFECRICGSKHERFKTIEGMYSHLEKVHGDEIPNGWSVQQYAYYLKTGKTHGNCVICKGKTKFNLVTGKYYRLCEKKACSDKNREIFKKRMIGKYGKVSLLDDPEQQKKMLANRKISGTYTWSDGKKFTYTGSYELDFLRFLDVFLNFPSQDIECPSPHTYYYEYEGKKHFYIPDVYIQSLNLEIEVKDGGNNPNTHHKIQEVDKIKETLKDKVMLSQSAVSYVKVTNKEYDTFFKYLYKMKDQYNDKDDKFKPIFVLGESAFSDEFTDSDVLLEAPVDTSSEEVVFYISSEPELKTIRPTKSKNYPDLGNIILASPFKEFATALGTNLSKDHIKMISTVKGNTLDIKIELLDKYAPTENKFSIYVLSKEGFEPIVKDGEPSKVRYYKQGDAQVIREIKVSNWRRYINRFPNVKLINFPNDEEAKEIEKEKLKESSLGMDTFTEIFGEGRDATVEEQQSVTRHVEEISEETGINFWDEVSPVTEAKLPLNVYHGSKHLFDVLRATGIDFGNSFQDMGWSLFAWTNRKAAIGWGVWEVFRHLKTIDENIILNGCLNSQTTVVWQSVYEYLKENIHKYSEDDLALYVYTVPTKTNYEYGLGHSSNTPRCVTIRTTEDIIYSKVDKIIMDIDMVEKYCKIVPDGYEPTNKEYGKNYRLTSFLMKYDFMYQPKLRNSINNAVKSGELQPGDDLRSFFKNNNIDLKTVSFKERISDIISKESIDMELVTESVNTMDEKDISYSNSFSDVKNIVDSLPKEDLNKICNGEFKNSPYVFYREVLLVKKEPVAFIDVYKLPDMKEDGVIVIATKEKWRRFGLGARLASRMKSKLKDKNLIWKTQKDNTSSKNLAKKMKFKPTFESTDTELVTEEANNIRKYNFIYLDLKKDNVDKYLKQNSYCREYMDYVTKDCIGEIAVDKDADKIAGFIFMDNKKYKGFISPLIVEKKYRNVGLGTKLLKDAISEYGAKDLVVKKSNKVALDMYLKNGFVPIGYGSKGKSEYWLKLKSRLTNEDKMLDITESVDMELVTEEANYSSTNKYPVFIVLMHSGTTLANVIRAFTRDEFSHACISFNSKLDPLYSFGNKKVNIIDPGFVIQNPDSKFYKRHKAYYNVFVMYVDKVSYDKMQEKLQFFIDNKDDLKYDLASLFKIACGKPSEESKKYFCSKFCMNVIGAGRELEKVPSLWKPEDIKGLDDISLVDKGVDFSLYDYRNTEENLKKIKKHQFTKESLEVVDESSSYYRITYNGNGIYEEYKKLASMDQWKSFKGSEACEWLPVPPAYNDNYTSYFTAKGYEMFRKLTYPELVKVLDESEINIDKIDKLPKPVYKDKYQVVCKESVEMGDLMLESLELYVTKPKYIGKNITLYHASPKRLDRLDPNAPNVGTRLSGARSSSFWIDEPTLPIAFAVRRLIMDLQIENRCQDVCYMIDKETSQIKVSAEDVNNFIKEIKTKKIYLHEKTVPSSIVGRGHGIGIGEFTLDISVVPDYVKEYSYDDFKSFIVFTTEEDIRNTYEMVASGGNYSKFMMRNSNWVERLIYLDAKTYSERSKLQSSFTVSDKFVKDTLIEMNDELNGYGYGIPKNGVISDIPSEKFYYENWKYLSPKEFSKVKGGTCWDYVAYQTEYLASKNIKVRNFYIIDEKGETHTISIITSNGKFYYPESSFKRIHGLYVHKNLKSIFRFVIKEMGIKNYWIYEFKKNTNYGCSCEEYMQWMKEKGKLVLKGKANTLPNIDKIDKLPKPVYKDKYQVVCKESFEEVTGEIMNEAYIKNEKDIYYNKDKFDSGEINLCFITGHSGSGKSTMARNMTNKSNIEHYELDDVIANWNFSDDNLKEYGDLIYSFFKGVGKKFRYKSYEDWSNDSKWDTPDGNGDKYERELTPSFINYCKSYTKSQKDTKIVVEGVWLFHYIEPSELEKYAVYVKGTSLLASKVRAAKRNASPMQTNFAKARVFLRAMTNFTNWKYRLLDEKRITKYRNYFGNKVEKNIKESTLTTEERDELSTPDYGIPILKKYPMPDEAHVKSAIRFFNYVDEEYEELLAKNIKKKIKEFNMEVNVGKNNRLSKYL